MKKSFTPIILTLLLIAFAFICMETNPTEKEYTTWIKMNKGVLHSILQHTLYYSPTSYASMSFTRSTPPSGICNISISFKIPISSVVSTQ